MLSRQCGNLADRQPIRRYRFDLHAGFEAVDVTAGVRDAGGKRSDIGFVDFIQAVPDPRTGGPERLRPDAGSLSTAAMSAKCQNATLPHLHSGREFA